MSPLTEEQKREALLILSVGCDEETAARYVGCSPEALAREAAADSRFATDRGRAQAATELSHMRNVQQAARDEKHWRASVWWLERHAPDRYGRRSQGAVSSKRIEGLLHALANAVAAGVHDAEDRARVMQSIERIATSSIGISGLIESVSNTIDTKE